ncbi:hypothetical protein HDU92_004483 [Lobulomyces angularis]|nr:hypothetical protein HDU92_004483 [Lobulomyces angularis]
MFSSYSWTVKTTTFNQIANDLTADINLYVQPGGNLDVGEMFSYFSSDDVNALQNYVKNGGKFYGICLGAFLAGRDYFGLYNESVQEKVDFTIAKTPKFFVLNESRELFTEEPPELGKGKPGVANNIYGTFEDSSILSKIVDFGKGKVGLMAAHPEATSSWNKRVTVSDGQGYDVGITFANWLLGDYNTVVPRYNAGLSVGAKIGIAVAVLVAAVIILAAVIIYRKRSFPKTPIAVDKSNFSTVERIE